MEGQAEHLDVEVNGVASQIALRPAPVAVFEDQAGIGGQTKIVRLAYEELESALLEQWPQGGQPSGADLFARPTDWGKIGSPLFIIHFVIWRKEFGAADTSCIAIFRKKMQIKAAILPSI